MRQQHFLRLAAVLTLCLAAFMARRAAADNEAAKAAPADKAASAPADPSAPAAVASADGNAGDGKAADGAKPAGEKTADGKKDVVKPWYVEMLTSGALGYMISGGLFMWPILAMGILAAGVTIERMRSLKMLDTDTSELRGEVLRLLQADRGAEALELCLNEQGPVPAVLAAGIRKYLILRKLNYDPAKIEEQVVKAMEDYSVHIVAALERHLPILATISSVAPMVGSVGTVTGMIILFKDIVAKMGTTNIIEAAAAGIQVKLLVTVWGLIVGIPAYVAFNYFTTVINRYVLNVEESAAELMEAVTLQMSFSNNASSAAVAAQATLRDGSQRPVAAPRA